MENKMKRGFKVRLEDWYKIKDLFDPTQMNSEKLAITATKFPDGRQVMFSDAKECAAVTELMVEMDIEYQIILEKK